MSRWPLMATLAALAVGVGCRQAEPPEFTPGPDVVELTEGLDPEEDKDDLKTLQDLQNQIATVLAERVGTPEKIKMLGDPHVSEERLARGAELYAQYCVQCHGVNGDGNGPLAVYLNPRPRNYTAGVFKFVATENGSKARRADIVKTLYRGVTGTSMPSFDVFTDSDREAVADYVLALTYRGLLQTQLAQIAYDEEELPDSAGIDQIVDEVLEPWRAAQHEVVMPLSPMPVMTAETIAHGQELFLQYSCNKCHGNDGRGGSVGSVDVGKDVWGYNAAAADLTSGMFRGGGRPIDLYRRVLVGINGAPMPSRRADLANDPDAIWHIVHFIKDTGEKRRRETVEATLTALNRMVPAEIAAEVALDAEAEADEAADAKKDADAQKADADAAASEPKADDADKTPAESDDQTPAAENDGAASDDAPAADEPADNEAEPEDAAAAAA
ncbi:MAG: c-type cytochrome [Planctomycetales bacterium]|nr:c-type cytochrome [Planctomycetales bacterium]